MSYYVGLAIIAGAALLIGHEIDKLRKDMKKMKDLWYDRFGENID